MPNGPALLLARALGVPDWRELLPPDTKAPTRLVRDLGAEQRRKHPVGCVDIVAKCETDRRPIARANRCKHELVLLIRLEIIAGRVEEVKNKD